MSKPKALLICNEGIDKRMELMGFIEKVLPTIEVVDCSTVYQLKNARPDGYDFIISTEDVQSAGKPIVDLSAVDRSEYAGFITEFLSSSAYNVKNPTGKKY